MKSTRTANLLLTGSESATELSHPRFASSPRPPPLSSVQVGPQHQAVAKATNHKGQQVYGGDDGEGGRPVTVVTVEEGEGRRGGGGEEVCF